MNRPRIIVEIDELVLHGFDPRDRSHIGDAVRTEMATLLAGTAIADIPRRPVDRLDAGQFRRDGQSAEQIGQSTARSLHRSLV
jgi:hypothetical protein